jgi:hypothetical protein
MDQSTKLILVISIIVIMTIVILKPFERFTNSIGEEDMNTSINSDALTNPERDYVKYLIDTVLENVNKNYNRKFVLGSLEGVERIPNQDGTDRYIIKCFIYTTNEFVNRKFVFDLSVDKEKKFIDINRIYLGSSQNPILERSQLSERGTLLFKPKSNINLVSAEQNISTLDSSKFTVNSKIKNYTTSPKERVSDYRHPELDLIKNTFPCRIVHHLWDTASLMKVECPNEKKKCLGPYSGTRPPVKTPEYNPTLFEGRSVLYHDLFDKAQDSASRPVGIG